MSNTTPESRYPSVSVIVPNYNHARYLPQRIESILNQSFTDYELILLDDCSSDDSVEVLRRYENCRCVKGVFVNNSNSGSPFAQWRKGISLSSGDYVWIAESDDWANTSFLEELVSLLKHDRQTVLAYCRSQTVNSRGDVMPKPFWPDALDKERWQANYTNNGDDEIRRYLRFRNTIPNASAVVFRRTAILGIDIPQGMRFTGDWLVWIRLLKLGRVAYSSKELSFFREHAGTSRGDQEPSLERQRIREYMAAIREAGGISDLWFGKNAANYEWIIRRWQRTAERTTRKPWLPPWPLMVTYLRMLKWRLQDRVIHG